MAVVGAFDLWLVAPFMGWLACYIVTLWYFVPRLAKVAQAQADARSLMTGRVTDAYTNIATVKPRARPHVPPGRRWLRPRPWPSGSTASRTG